MRRANLRVVGVVLLVFVIAALDAASPGVVLVPFLVVPVLLASAFATVRETALVAVLSVVAAIALGRPDDEFGTGDHIIRTAAVAVVAGFAIYLARVRERRDTELQHRALHDPLTGLANRELLSDRLQQLLLRREQAGLLAVLFIDLDGFKAVNDTHGHAAGDALLCHVAQCLSRVTRATDTLARFAGDEFVLVCPDLPDAAEVNEMAERVLIALSAPLRLASGEITVSASIGVAVDGRHDLDEATLIKAADHAMFDAKRRGDHRYSVAHPRPAAPS